MTEQSIWSSAQLSNRMSKEILVRDDSQNSMLCCMKCLFVFKRVSDQALLKRTEIMKKRKKVMLGKDLKNN